LAEGEHRAQTQVVITDVTGDTLQTLDGPGNRGIHRVSWSFQGKAPPRAELSPSQVRDSIINVQKLEGVFDSLVAEGMNEQMLTRIKERFLSGDTQGLFSMFQRGSRGGGGRATGFQERPGESAPARQAGAGRAAGGQRPEGAQPGERPEGAQRGERQAAGGPGAGMMPDQETMQEIMRAVRNSLGRGFSFGGRGGGGGGRVNTGDFLATITVNGQTVSKTIRVERLVGGGGFGFGFEENER